MRPSQSPRLLVRADLKPVLDQNDAGVDPSPSRRPGVIWRNLVASLGYCRSPSPVRRRRGCTSYGGRSGFTSPAAGRCGTSSVGRIGLGTFAGARRGRATTRNTRGLTRSTIRLIVPPLTAMSGPSNTMQSFAPVAFTHSCNATNSACSVAAFGFVFLALQLLRSPAAAFLLLLLMLLCPHFSERDSLLNAGVSWTYHCEGVARGDRPLPLDCQDSQRLRTSGTSGPEAAGRIGDLINDANEVERGTRLNAPSPTAGPCDTCWFAGASTLALAVNCSRRLAREHSSTQPRRRSPHGHRRSGAVVFRALRTDVRVAATHNRSLRSAVCQSPTVGLGWRRGQVAGQTRSIRARTLLPGVGWPRPSRPRPP